MVPLSLPQMELLPYSMPHARLEEGFLKRQVSGQCTSAKEDSPSLEASKEWGLLLHFMGGSRPSDLRTEDQGPILQPPPFLQAQLPEAQRHWELPPSLSLTAHLPSDGAKRLLAERVKGHVHTEVHLPESRTEERHPLLHLISPAGCANLRCSHTGIPPAGVTSSPTHPFQARLWSLRAAPRGCPNLLALEHLPLPTSKVPCDEENRLHCHATLPFPKTLVPKAAPTKKSVPSVSAITTVAP